ncbi:DUF664 domain-containing protein [Actinomadura geliboluensis]|uniref:mycothiol transferase n=1 Tax=Actinomadura geliboluensis TaxID=882440 RepID=UPI0033A38555
MRRQGRLDHGPLTHSRRRQLPPLTPCPALLDGPGTDVTDARELLLGYLEWYREALTRKISGLPDELLRTPVEPLGWSPLGLVQHLGRLERRWMRSRSTPATPATWT